MTRPVFQLLVLLLALGYALAGRAASVDAWLDRTQIAEGDTVQLTLEARGQVSGQPDTAPLEQDFDILGTSTGSRISIVNGQTDARTSWTLTLSPKHGGKLTIPPLRVGGSTTPALALTVSDAPAPTASGGADIFIETSVEPRHPYVQQQVLYTVRLLAAVPISNGQLSEPKPADTLVEPLGDDREYTTVRDGRRYRVTERRYALFPQGSGRLELDAPVFDGEVPASGRRTASPLQRFFGNDPMFGRSLFNDLMTPVRRTRVRGKALAVDVRPRAGASQGAQWLPAEQLTLTGSWQPESGEVPAGDPVTLQLDITAKGLTGGQLPNLAPAAVDGFDVYPDQAQRQTDTGASGVTGHLHQKIAFIPRRAGRLSLPDIQVSWWDTQAGRERVARLPGRVLQVAPATGRPDTAAPVTHAQPQPASPAGQRAAAMPSGAARTGAVQSEKPGGTSAWLWVSAALGAVWVLTLAAWWWRGRRREGGGRQVTPPSDTATIKAGAARRQYLAACRSGDASAARTALLEWAAAHWPDDPPRGLQALAQRLDDAAAREALTGLDRALYSGGAGWDGRTLASCLQQLPSSGGAGDGRGRKGLAPLYPETTHHSYG